MGLKIKYILMCSLIIMFLLAYTSKPAYAWGPVSHLMLTQEAIARAKTMNADSEIIRLITKYQSWFYCGFMFPDVTVIKYYTEFKSYHNTHVLTFYDTLWKFAVEKNSEQAKAFVIGVGTHLIQDSIVHNYYIPAKIKNTLIQNSVIHPVTEGVIESKFISNNVTAQQLAINSFSMYQSPFTDMDPQLTPVEFVKQAFGGSETYDYENQANTFSTLLGSKNTIYGEGGYWVPSGGLEGLWGLYKSFAGVLQNFLSVSDYEQFREKTVEQTAEWYAYGSPTADGLNSYMNQLDPSGIDSLRSADSYVVQWFFVIAIITSLLAFVYYKRKK